MNLERLRKRVRQYLDQVGGPDWVCGARAGRAGSVSARRGAGVTAIRALGGEGLGRPWAFIWGQQRCLRLPPKGAAPAAGRGTARGVEAPERRGRLTRV